MPESALLIVADGLRPDHLGHYGYGRPTSPGLDALEKQAMVFELCLSSSPSTKIGLGAILSGRMQVDDGTGGAAAASGLAGFFGSEGRATALVSNDDATARDPALTQGFGEILELPAGGRRGADAAVDTALTWMAERDTPFFLTLHLVDAKAPYDPPKEYQQRFASDATGPISYPMDPARMLSASQGRVDAADRARILAAYDAEVAFLDAQVTRLLAELGQRGTLADMVVLFSASHGTELFDHGRFGSGYSLHHEQLGVPLMVWGPAIRPHRIAVLTSTLDVMPSLIDAVGLTPPDSLDGVSIWPLCVGTATHAPAPRELYFHTAATDSEFQAILRWPLKLILNRRSGNTRVFDLLENPREGADPAASESPVAQELLSQLEARFGD